MKRLAAVAGAGLALLVAGTARAALEQEGQPYPTGDAPYGAYAADFSGDGRPDVAALNGTSSDVNLFFRQPVGGFVNGGTVSLGAGSGPSFAAVGDYNGDGRSDLAVAKFVSGPALQVLVQQPAGGLAIESQVGNSFANASAVGAGDFNSDGRTDIVLATWSGSSVQLFLRNAANTGFAAGASFGTGPNPRQIEVADFNRDDLPDIAVTNNGGNSVTVLLRQGSGFVAEGLPIPVGTAPQDLVVADFNRDGRNDIAVSNTGSSSVSVLLRNEGSGFTDEGPVTLATGPVGITAADFDQDGWTDLATAGGGEVHVLRRNAGGGFTPDAPIAIPSAYGIASADFDADSRPDLAVTALTNEMRLLRNPAPAQPPAPTPTPPAPTPTPLPEPVAGRTVNAAPVSGAVKVKLPRTTRYVDLSQAQQLPVGTSVDARRGTVEIKAANDGGTAKFFDGVFKISQTKGKKPLTTLTLTEPLSCPKGRKASASAKKKSRRLWGDGKGSFRTSGRYSAATVRGTKWLVTDRCTTTTTKVAQGSVSVRDFEAKRTKVVRAGKRYVARRRG